MYIIDLSEAVKSCTEAADKAFELIKSCIAAFVTSRQNAQKAESVDRLRQLLSTLTFGLAGAHDDAIDAAERLLSEPNSEKAATEARHALGMVQAEIARMGTKLEQCEDLLVHRNELVAELTHSARSRSGSMRRLEGLEVPLTAERSEQLRTLVTVLKRHNAKLLKINAAVAEFIASLDDSSK